MAYEPTFQEWRAELVHEYVRQGGMTREEAVRYVDHVGDASLYEAYSDDYTPSEAVGQDMLAGADCLAD